MVGLAFVKWLAEVNLLTKFIYGGQPMREGIFQLWDITRDNSPHDEGSLEHALNYYLSKFNIAVDSESGEGEKV